MFIRLSKLPSPAVIRTELLPTNEFHILASARDQYQFDESLFATTGNVIFPNFHAARVFAKKMNDRRDLARHPEQAVRAGHLNALGLIDEIFHFVIRSYEETVNPGVLERAAHHLSATVSTQALETTIEEFVTQFPPLRVYKGLEERRGYLDGYDGGRSNRVVSIEELMLLYFVNFNPAARQYKELFADTALSEGTAYSQVISELEAFFRKEKTFGPENQAIFDLLRAPILAHPDSLEAQLGFIKSKWGMILSQRFLDRILGGLDLLQEENKIVFGGGGVANVPVYREGGTGGILAYGSFEAERFTADLEWMPKVVLLAKNTYVWLSQLSKKYQRSITTLDQIPDEELDQLARWKFTGLWLIGLWERSSASQKIKQWTGNPEAVPSAYSLFDYEIAGDLGGERAFQNLNHRAWQRGIRLAGDMVPNHMGIYSRWVVEHPEYFIQSDYCPFPGYRFTGGNLSENPDVQLRVEDGYWSRTDAAVVFQRIDNRTGKISYVYHGNDGTNMPWNDTAQLDLLRSEVREAVIQMIFHVARKFSIIRFDAAMTLTKKHFQRLWYPQPGTGGDIPSRADHALSSENFDRLFPGEFWREVVDRINESMPSTLLLAEAFWLMEGYFVRTLGMHRVYNSAFMHMLMKEENEKYRYLIKNTLEFNPEILKRYVNFMSNPDEQTAIAQFGKDDKYFGVALMMVTLPGLPMFGHGQVEGFTEKYGMEYKRAYYDEYPDDQLVRRHEHEIFPIMGKRHLFSDVVNFEFYDFRDAKGNVNHNVFAFSNMSGGERALIFYHNKYQECRGWIRQASPKSVPGNGGERAMVMRSLGESLQINARENFFYTFKDYKANLEFVRSGREIHEKGFYAELKAFEYHVFLDFREIEDHTGEYARVARQLRGKGVPSIQAVITEMRQAPVHEELRKVFSSDSLDTFASHFDSRAKRESQIRRFAEFEEHVVRLCEEVARYRNSPFDASLALSRLRRDLEALSVSRKLLKEGLIRRKKTQSSKNIKRSERSKSTDRNSELLLQEVVLLLSEVSLAGGHLSGAQPLWDPFKELGFAKFLQGVFEERGRSRAQARRELSLAHLLAKHADLLNDADRNNRFVKVELLFEDYDAREYVGINLHAGKWYYHKESFEELLHGLIQESVRRVTLLAQGKESRIKAHVKKCLEFASEMSALSVQSGYEVDQLRTLLSG
ncbi:MAG TPA: alpha-amylase family glycosyl hydrolase [Bacteroidota bacterium]|nr:alpha-amylase family glycosyl hydrolase [Bacteroidota bacterium]